MVSRMECNAVNASLFLNLVDNNFLIFLTDILPILNPCLPPKSKNLRPHYSQSSRENATPSSGTSPLASCRGVPPPPLGFPCSAGGLANQIAFSPTQWTSISIRRLNLMTPWPIPIFSIFQRPFSYTLSHFPY